MTEPSVYYTYLLTKREKRGKIGNETIKTNFGQKTEIKLSQSNLVELACGGGSDRCESTPPSSS